MFENIEGVLCDELHALDEKYKNGADLTSGDLQKADILFHALKSAATYKAMKEETDDGMSERSYARARSRTTGRYISRDGGMRSGYDPRQAIDPYYDRRY